MKLAHAALVAVLFLAPPGRALAGGERAPARDFDDPSRHGWTWELGAGPWVGATSGASATTWTIGGALDVGVHHVVAPISEDGGEKGGLLPTVEGLRWCAGLGCGVPLLLLFAPPDSLLGNEVGFDVRAVGGDHELGGSGAAFRLVVRPVFRYAKGAFRTTTLAGTVLPELGAAWSPGGGPAAFTLAWIPEAFEVLLDGRHLALGVDPIRIGALVPLDGSPAAFEAGTALTVRWVR
jgi:hypothetical protein